MRLFRFLGTLVGLVLISPWAQAQTIPLQNLSQGDFDKFVNEFSANSMHTSVSGASSLGLFGFELGVVGGVTSTPEINRLVNTANANVKSDSLPHGAILGVVSVPLGFTVEAGFIPKVGGKDFKVSTLNLAVKWTPTEFLLTLPLSLALKAHLASTSVQFAQTVQTVPTTFKYSGTVSGLTAFASKDFGVVEPYVGLGVVRAVGEMDANGYNQVFNFSATQSAKSTRTGGAWMIGGELKLLVAKLGVEYARAFGAGSYNGKLSFYF